MRPAADKSIVVEANAKILILEDDNSMATALAEVFRRAGHTVFPVGRPEDAIATLSANKIDYLFVDCLLPGVAGPDFVQRMYEQFPASKFKVVMMSGVFTDRAFISEASKKTKAVGFLQKPFDLADALAFIKVADPNAAAMPTANLRRKLYGMFADPNVNARKKRKVIEEVDEISGYDLPFIYSLLVETASSGNFFIYYPNKTVSSITFCNGHIVGVDIEDKTTYLGEMLIQSGYATPEDVQAALSQKRERRLGQYLIHGNQLSPHAFDIILEEQMNLRLAKTITSEKVKINFAVSETEMISPNIDSEILLSFLHDWIASKIPTSWLKNLFMNWSGNQIVFSPAFHKDHPALQMGLVKATEGLLDDLASGANLTKISNSKKYNEDTLYKALHFLLTRGLVVFAERESFKSTEEQKVSLKNIEAQLMGKSPFEVFQYIEASTMSTGGHAEMLKEFIGLLGEQPEDRSSEVYKIWTELYNRVQEAFIVAKDSQQREVAQAESLRVEAEKKLKANSQFEEGKKHLDKNSYMRALSLFSDSFRLNPSGYQIRLYLVWARLGSLDNEKKAIQLKEIEVELTQIPPDEKYDCIFPYVLGLYSKAKGDLNSARRSFQKSLGIDSTFLPAKRELNLLESANRKQDILKMDLKDVVSGFFKKR